MLVIIMMMMLMIMIDELLVVWLGSGGSQVLPSHGGGHSDWRSCEGQEAAGLGPDYPLHCAGGRDGSGGH